MTGVRQCQGRGKTGVGPTLRCSDGAPDAAYDRFVAPHVSADDGDKFVALDVEGGAYEIDADEITAVHRLVARRPDAAGRVGVVRVGTRYAHKLRSPRLPVGG